MAVQNGVFSKIIPLKFGSYKNRCIFVPVITTKEYKMTLTTVTATPQERGILKALMTKRITNLLDNGVTPERVKEYTADKRWQHVMSQKVFQFQKENF